MNKKIQIPIGEEDIRMFEELVNEGRESFTWTFDKIDVEFIKDEGDWDREHYELCKELLINCGLELVCKS